ncbi:MAG: sulfatase [Puniceicoccaceae bacterium]|nr:MAG: sulfatase [Puniceicoccaceae bacterium]
MPRSRKLTVSLENHDRKARANAPAGILWIAATQWRGQALGVEGDPDARTPALDRLAAGGVRCADACAEHPFGPWSRAALLTGVRAPRNGVRHYHDGLRAGLGTAGHWFGRVGRRTGFFGKWQVSRRTPGAVVLGETAARQPVEGWEQAGFDVWEGFDDGFLANDIFLHGLGADGRVRIPGYQADVLVERIQKYITESAERPWFGVLSLEPPHPPYEASAAGIPGRDPAALTLRPNLPRGGEAEAKARRELAGYHAHLEAVDRAVGRLLDWLAATGRGGSTLVVFTSVHGDMHGSHGCFRKGWPYEEAVRIPLLWSWPGRLPAGVVRSEPVGLADLLPTTLALAGEPVPEELDGQALDGWLVRGEGGREVLELGMPTAAPFPLQCDRPWEARRTADGWMAVRSGGQPWLLHNLRADPYQLSNDVKSAEAAARFTGLFGPQGSMT